MEYRGYYPRQSEAYNNVMRYIYYYLLYFPNKFSFCNEPPKDEFLSQLIKKAESLHRSNLKNESSSYI